MHGARVGCFKNETIFAQGVDAVQNNAEVIAAAIHVALDVGQILAGVCIDAELTCATQPSVADEVEPLHARLKLVGIDPREINQIAALIRTQYLALPCTRVGERVDSGIPVSPATGAFFGEDEVAGGEVMDTCKRDREIDSALPCLVYPCT